MKKSNLKDIIKKVFLIVKDYKKEYLLIILFCIIASIFSSLSPYVLGLVTDSIYASVENNLPIEVVYISKILLLVLICYLVDAISTYFKSYLSSKIGQKIGYDLRNKIIVKLNKIKLKQIDSMKKGDIISKVTNDVERLTDNITEVIPQLVYNITLILSVVIMMFVLNIELAIITICVIPLTFIILSVIVKKSQKYFELNQKAIGSVNSFVEETVTNNDIIKSFSKEKYFNSKFDKECYNLSINGFKSSFYSSLSIPLNKFLGNINYVVIVGIGAFKVINGTMRIGAIQSYIQYLKDFNKPMNVIAQVISNLQMAIASYDRINDILSLEEENNGDIKTFSFEKSIEFKNVTFGYNENKNILKDFNLVINKGEKIALVGKTGAGKTTIVNLLMNFYDNYTGNIYIDGVDIRDIDKSVYRKFISMVLQDTWLYEGTIKENLVFESKISESKLNKILDNSKILHMINGLPDGLEFMINEETNNISSGQKQLLTIARALIASPDILILDEATSNVDTRLEYLINESFKYLMENRTSIVIAHRLSTIVNSDKIVVIKDGKVLECGKHEELLSNKKYYYDLYTSQFEVSDEKE